MKTITIICRDGNDFDVHCDEEIANRLCWDEMLASVAELTHPRLGSCRFMVSPDTHLYRMERHAIAARRLTTTEE